MKKVTIAFVAAVLMSVSSVDAAASAAKKPGMMSNMMNYGRKAMAGASQMGGQAVAGAKSMMAPKAPVANAPAAPAKPGMMSNMFNSAKQAAGAVKAKMPGMPGKK